MPLTLSEARAFTAGYLTGAAACWSGQAVRWVEAYDRVATEVLSPGGTTWSGEAAESAATRVGDDRQRVLRAADELQAAATTARRSAADLLAARTALLDTVRAAEAAGFAVGEDFSVSFLDSGLSAATLADRDRRAEAFAIALHSRIRALFAADETAAAQIASAAAGLPSLSFSGETIQAVGFHDTLFPERPVYSEPEPPPGGWSSDPLMRAAQRIAYGHAFDKHGHEFSGMTKAQLAELVYQQMLRAVTDPKGLILGGSRKDGAPLVYDPQSNVLIVRDTRPGAPPDGGTVFRPNLLSEPNTFDEVFGSYTPVFTQEQLADGAVMPPPGTQQGSVGVGAAAPTDERPRTLPDWGTAVSPDELAEIDGELGIIGTILRGQRPPHVVDLDHIA